MPLASDGYKISNLPNVWDSIKGSLRKINQIYAWDKANAVAEISATTQATGTNWTTLASQAANGNTALTADNGSGTSLTFRRVGATATYTFASGARISLMCLANANEWQVQRTDTSNTTVTVKLTAYYSK